MRIRIIFTLVLLCGLATNLLSQNNDNDNKWKRAMDLLDNHYYREALNILESLMDDESYRKDCEDVIEHEIKPKMAYITCKTQNGVVIDEQFKLGCIAVDTLLYIKSNYNWDIQSFTHGVKVEKKGKGKLRILIQEDNKGLSEKVDTVVLSSGSFPNKVVREIRIVQEAHPAYLRPSTKSLSFTADSLLSSEITVYTNHTSSQWGVCNYDEQWCCVECDSNNIKITVKENTSVENRETRIEVNSILDSRLNFIVNITQTAGDAELLLTKQDLEFPADSVVPQYVRVSSNTRWHISDFPTWAVVERVGSSDSIRVLCYENLTGVEREANINVKSGNKILPIHLRQMAKSILFSKRNVLAGRNISFGLSAGYLFPFVNSSSSGNYTGSVINYSLGNGEENVRYCSGSGFTMNAIVDFRVYRNWYIKTGIDFAYIKYENSFNADVDRTFNKVLNTVYKGTFQNDFNESYEFGFINIPVMASHRFVFDDWNNVQVDFGPVVSFALSGKMSFEGNSNSDNVYPHSVNNYNEIGPAIGNRTSEYTRYTGEMNLFDTKVNCTTTSTVGGMSKDYLNEYSAVAAPFKRVNLALRFGVVYECAGVQVGLVYTQMLTNMANRDFWDSRRLPLFGKTSDVLMAGYKHMINTLEIKLGYVFRY